MSLDLYALAKPWLYCLSPETAHRWALRATGLGLAGNANTPDDPRLASTVFGRTFANPIGLAAGFDKNAEAIGGLFGMGFGFVEVGGVTPLPQSGNPKPRVFRLSEDGAVINRMGFNNFGLAAMQARLAAWQAKAHPGIVAVNLGKNKESVSAVSDYQILAATLAPLADMLVLNVSSPNTPGLRSLQKREALAEILQGVKATLAQQSSRTPLLLKIAPDLTADDEEDIAAVVLAEAIDGLVVSNTTLARPESLRSEYRRETGGLSGAPLFAPSTALLGRFYRRLDGRIPLIGVGGIASGAEAYAKIRAGASLVQLYTALVYHGPRLIPAIKRDLLTLLARDGFGSISEAVGADHRPSGDTPR